MISHVKNFAAWLRYWRPDRIYRRRLQAAARRGDDAFLDAELAKHQLTAENLSRLDKRHTPLAEWPDDDVNAMFAPRPTEVSEPAHA